MFGPESWFIILYSMFYRTIVLKEDRASKLSVNNRPIKADKQKSWLTRKLDAIKATFSSAPAPEVKPQNADTNSSER